VYRFWDRWGQESHDGRWNYIGDGITVGERVLSVIKDADDIIYLSAETRQALMDDKRQSSFVGIPWLQNRGRRADKRRSLRRVYEVNHTGWLGSFVLAWLENHL
jgi:class 3 adenylate cyclase